MAKEITTNLNGTEKQVAWAEDIRKAMADTLSSMLEDSRSRFDADGFAAHEKAFDAKVWSKLEAVTDAKWFIDHRRYVKDNMSGNDKLWLVKLVSEM